MHGHPQMRDSFRFTGTIKQVVTDISGELIEDDEAKVRMMMARQSTGAPIDWPGSKKAQ